MTAPPKSSSCTGKQGFHTFSQGSKVIKRMRKIKHAKVDGQLSLYRCSYCPHWHIGHSRGAVRS